MSKRLWPMFSLYGSKWRAAPHYPTPKYDLVVEPFAGSACYSLLHYSKQILLSDIDPIIAGVWRYLIAVTESEILSLPPCVGHVDELNCCQEAKHLIGFWLNKGKTSPCKQPGSWMRSGIRPNSYWGQVIKERIAKQLQFIRHWRIENCSYQSLCFDCPATVFVDPPYQQAHGRYYRHHEIDYALLRDWCLSNLGQTIVCESTGAGWLPFQEFRTVKSNPSSRGKSYSSEVIWTSAIPGCPS